MKPDRKPSETERQMREAQRNRPLLDNHCPHEDLNAHKTRCLSCGMWMKEGSSAD